MELSGKQSPAIKQIWLRILLFIIAFQIIVALLTVIMIIPAMIPLFKNGNVTDIAGKLKLVKESMSQPPVVYFIALGSFLGSLLSVWIFMKYVDRKPFKSIGFATKGYGSDTIAGFCLGIALLGIGSLYIQFAQHLKWLDVSFNITDILTNIAVMAMIAVGEEVAMRGYILRNLVEKLPRRIALLISAVVFLFFHAGNPGMGIIPALNIFLAGLLLGINYSFTRNLWFAIAFHFSWNFFQGPVFGYQVSGLSLNSILQQEMEGQSWFTGGVFGFEGSVVCSALLILAIIGMEWFYTNKARQKSLQEVALM